MHAERGCNSLECADDAQAECSIAPRIAAASYRLHKFACLSLQRLLKIDLGKPHVAAPHRYPQEFSVTVGFLRGVGAAVVYGHRCVQLEVVPGHHLAAT